MAKKQQPEKPLKLQVGKTFLYTNAKEKLCMYPNQLEIRECKIVNLLNPFFPVVEYQENMKLTIKEVYHRQLKEIPKPRPNYMTFLEFREAVYQALQENKILQLVKIETRNSATERTYSITAKTDKKTIEASTNHPQKAIEQLIKQL